MNFCRFTALKKEKGEYNNKDFNYMSEGFTSLYSD